MFKKRSRPAAVRDRTPDAEDAGAASTSTPASPLPAAASTAASAAVSAAPSEPGSREDTPEGQSIEHMIMVRRLRRAQQGIDLERFNRGDTKRRAKRSTAEEIAAYGLQEAGGLQAGSGPGGPGSSGASSSARAEAGGEAAGGAAGDKEEDALARKVRLNNFTQQTNALDVNKHMMAFIETEMAKKKKGAGGGESGGSPAAAGASGGGVRDDAQGQGQLYDLAERYAVPGARAGEDEEGNVTTSLGMLSAIPEVDLGMDNRLRNIEETEKAKRELMERRAAEKEARERGESSNDDPLASTRFYRGPPREVDIQKEMAKGRREAAGIEPRQHHHHHGQERAPRPEMASDEAVMDRFKKRMRR